MGYGLRVQEPGLTSLLWEHEQRIRSQELRGDEGWIYVGTVAVDGVDDLITDDSPPFLNDWTNSLGDDAPVSFRRTLNGWVHIRGGFTGGLDGTVIFTLPEGFRPEYQQQMVIPSASLTAFATCVVLANGDVTFGTVV